MLSISLIDCRPFPILKSKNKRIILIFLSDGSYVLICKQNTLLQSEKMR